MIDLRLGDCLEIMKEIPSKSIDAIICDLPYGVTQNKWDNLIDLDLLWEQYKRIRKINAPIILFAQTPFDKVLGVSNINELKYEWIWNKVSTSGHLNAKKMPLKAHENILVFYKKPPVYNPQKTQRTEKEIRRGWKNKTYNFLGNKNNNTGNYGDFVNNVSEDYEYDKKHPNTIITFSNGNGWSKKKALHPTQKPLELLEYLVKTYSNENDTILDNTMGSGTTGVACKNLNRKFIGIEMDDNYFKIAEKRINKII
jgi:DNA modification methylase